MEYNNQTDSSVVILGATTQGEVVCASSARISTKNGTSLEVFNKSQEEKNNKELILKVLSSGHKSIIEHIVFSIAFNNVSVFVEQFIIEFRLASYTVQSRRYVNFKNVGYHIPDELNYDEIKMYCNHMNYLFMGYEQLLNLDIPKEDARFVLPYCFNSNFFCTCNARELMHIITTMIYGRGKKYPEIYKFGLSLKKQFEKYLPGVFDNGNIEVDLASVKTEYTILNPTIGRSNICLISKGDNSAEKIKELNVLSNLEELIYGQRSRQLEFLNYAFKISGITLAGLTHLVRHRIQSILIPSLESVINQNTYILPKTINSNQRALEIYNNIYLENTKVAREFAKSNLLSLVYFNLSGNMLDVYINMNARELKHFIALRSCLRAQWEIKDLTDSMLNHLRSECYDLFKYFGPSCYIYKKCPEGKVSCGRFKEVKTIYDKKNISTL